MTPDASGWRSSADYAHAETLSASDLGWEWLRRNEAYDRDYRDFARNGSDATAMTEQIARRWGLRFPGRSAHRPARYTGLLAA